MYTVIKSTTKITIYNFLLQQQLFTIGKKARQYFCCLNLQVKLELSLQTAVVNQELFFLK